MNIPDLHPSEARFAILRDLLAQGEPYPAPPNSERDGGRKHAAVSLILREGPELEALLIKRAKAEGDPWSGHMALPGGRRDPDDADLLATAVRETHEETGVVLDPRRMVLGHLPTLEPSTFRLPPLSIHPFVFGVPGGTEASVASPEVDEVLWTPVRRFAGPEARSNVEIPLDDGRRTFPCFRVGHRVIWGLTFRILTDFLRRLEGNAPEVLGSPGEPPVGQIAT